MRSGCSRGALLGAIAALSVAAPAPAATVPVDALGPLGDQHVIFPLFTSEDHVPPMATVANAGDVNGDGLDDTAMLLDNSGPDYPATVWVTFSPTILPGTMLAGQPGWTGMQITGARFWNAIAALGDVNGDGLGELAVETSDKDVVVVFGQSVNATVDVGDLGDDGFRISNVVLGAGGGGGHGAGAAWDNSTMVSAGDQNGDDVPDLAFRDGNTVKVAYTPESPAGAVIDAETLGDDGFTLETYGDDYFGGPFVDRAGDLDGDGRVDLAVMWERSADHTVHGVGVVSPGPGEVVDLRTAADDGSAYEVIAENSHLENGITVGDQNGDGRRDVGLVVFGHEPFRDRSLVLGYAPALGATRTVRPVTPGEAEEFHAYDSNVHDVGDQDGDGRSDIAFYYVVRFSGSGSTEAFHPVGLGGALFVTGGRMIVGSVPDRNDDGKRELITVFAAGYDSSPPSSALWMLDIFLSATLPLPDEIDPPLDTGEQLEFTGTFATAPAGGTRTLAARASVELTGPAGGKVSVAAPDVVDANGPTTEASVTVDPNEAGLVRGRTYQYRMLLENGRGLVGASAKRSFVFRPPPPDGSGGPGTGGQGPVFHVIRGTSKADRLIGGAGRDRVLGLLGPDGLWGRGGADVLRGARGDDEIHGEAGRDLLVGGRGRDVLHGGPGDDVLEARDGRADRVRCGGGRDRVTADPQDELSGCEIAQG